MTLTVVLTLCTVAQLEFGEVRRTRDQPCLGSTDMRLNWRHSSTRTLDVVAGRRSPSCCKRHCVSWASRLLHVPSRRARPSQCAP